VNPDDELAKVDDFLGFLSYNGFTPEEEVMSKRRAAPKPRNLARMALANPLFRHKIERQKTGKASYTRKGRPPKEGRPFCCSRPAARFTSVQ
jgi:stalled ribosome alternative rescue factor ArfA